MWLPTKVRTTGLVLLLTLAVFGASQIPWRSRVRWFTSEASAIHSLAVLPLENLSGDPAEDYFADGVTDELITTLGQIRSLRVISRTSVMQYRRVHKTLPQIARELKVDAIVEGTVLRSGERVRITAQLIEASTDKHLWAQTYQADLRNVLGLQEQIANAIAQQIQIRLTPPQQIRLSRARTINPESYEWYLRGEYFPNRFTPNSTLKAAEYFQKAIEKDPNYAPAYCKLAGTYEILGNMGVIPNDLAHLKAKPLIAKAPPTRPPIWRGTRRTGLEPVTQGSGFCCSR
jgi:TolB-like protein